MEHAKTKSFWRGLGLEPKHLGLLLLVVAVPLIGIVKVGERWSTYMLSTKLLSGLLLSQFVLLPLIAVWREKAGRAMSRSEWAFVAYLWALLATLLFAR